MPFWEQIAGQAVGAGLGIMAGSHDREQNYKMQERLQALQIKGAKEMGDYNYQNQKKMWEETNYWAQVEQLKKAGLNPALLYGMGGAGGATTGSGSGAMPSGGDASVGSGQIIQGMGMQMGMQAAEIELIKAQTEKTKVEAAKTAGVDTTEAETRIAALTQGITNSKVQEGLLKVEQRLKDMQAFEQQKSQNDRMDYIAFQTGKAMQDLETAMAEAFVSRETQAEKVEIVKQEAIGATIRNALMETQIKVSQAQIQKWAQEISQGWKSLDQKDRELTIQKFETEIKAQFPGISQSIGRIINDGMEMIFNVIKGERRQHYNVK